MENIYAQNMLENGKKQIFSPPTIHLLIDCTYTAAHMIWASSTCIKQGGAYLVYIEHTGHGRRRHIYWYYCDVVFRKMIVQKNSESNCRTQPPQVNKMFNIVDTCINDRQDSLVLIPVDIFDYLSNAC